MSLLPAGDQPDTLFLGNYLLRKSSRNLKEDPRVGMLVITEALQGRMLTGEVVEFQEIGPYVDRQMNSALLRYNPYTDIRNVGIIHARSLKGRFHISKVRVAADYLRARLSGMGDSRAGNGGAALPVPARTVFARMIAVKVLAWVQDDGFAVVVPALSSQPAGDRRLVCAWIRSWANHRQGLELRPTS